MAKSGYTAVTAADVAVTSTAKSVLGVKAHANSGIELNGATVCFDGTTAGNEPVLIELCYATFASNSPGTNSTSVTPAQAYGRVIAVGATAARDWTTQPTVLTVLEEWLVHPQAGVVIQLPLGNQYDSAAAEGFTLRVTAPNDVNCRATMKFERC